MKWIIDLAIRNIKRNKRRTILAISSITLSVALTVFLNGFIAGMLDNLVKNVTKNETGHIRISTKDFAERYRFMPVDEIIYNPEIIISIIKDIPELEKEITIITERISFGTLLSNGPNSISAIGIAGEPEIEKELLNLNRSITEGRYIENSDETIIGKKAASSLNLNIGDALGILTQGTDYSLRFKNFKIVGFFETGLKQLDESFFQIPLADAKTFLRADNGTQQILIMLKDYKKALKITQIIKDKIAQTGMPDFNDIAINAWNEIGDYPSLINMMENIYGWIYIVILFLGAFIITNILMMIILERRREIGILKAMGLKGKEILFMFTAEGAVIGVIGSFIGTVMGFALCLITSIYGVDFSSAMEGINFPSDPVYYSKINPGAILFIFVLGIAVAIIVSILPSRKAAKMNAVDAIKSVI
ncbi:MAG: FtsX-like permease family protein [Spirochaetaceae bacterium]|nr:FtsX-like permease family protein [Spirochaetaceae bacterium]